MNNVSPFDFLNPNTEYSEKKTTVERLKICSSCEHFKFRVCKKCGCFMPAKVKLQEATCPIGKW